MQIHHPHKTLLGKRSCSFCSLIPPQRVKLGPAASAAAKLLQSFPTLCNPIDGSPPGFAVPGILQARVLEWGAIAFSSLAHWWSPNAFTQTQVIPIPKALAVATPPAKGRDEATCLRSQIYSVLGSEFEHRQAGSRAHRLSQPAVHSPGLGSSLLSWVVALYTWCSGSSSSLRL